MSTQSLIPLLAAAIAARTDLIDEAHQTAFRLFNGFFEGCPDLVADVYARTLVLNNYAGRPEALQPLLAEAGQFMREQLPWVRAIILKTRKAETSQARGGILIYGEQVDRQVQEHGVWYALDLLLHHDASLYLDTRNLRLWAIQHLQNKRVLNTFAYTGSLGVAAMAGGAGRVVHIDRSRKFLNIAKTSYRLNRFPIRKEDFRVGDFFPQVSQLRRASEGFDCVFLDPPFFSETRRGKIDLVNESHRAINKVRPLVNHGGYLVAINNALFVSGRAYMQTLEDLCADGYLSIEKLIPVPPDFTGYTQTSQAPPLVDPTPFNHATKIAILRVRRKEP